MGMNLEATSGMISHVIYQKGCTNEATELSPVSHNKAQPLNGSLKG